MKEVINFGVKVENYIYPVESRFVHNKDLPKPQSGSFSYALNNQLLVELPLTRDSPPHSDIRICNNRITYGGMGNMALGMWNSMNTLGITNVSNAYDPIARTQELEKSDNKEEKVAKRNVASYQC